MRFLLLIINAGRDRLTFGRCREIKVAPLRTPSIRSAVGSTSKDSPSSLSSASRPLPNIPAFLADGNSKIQRKDSGLAGQQKLFTRAASFEGRIEEPETSDLTSTSAKLTRTRSSREERRSSEDADGECLFEKIDRQGALVPLPRAKFEGLTVQEKQLLKKIAGEGDKICPKTGKNWSKYWRVQEEAWIQSAVNRPLEEKHLR